MNYIDTEPLLSAILWNLPVNGLCGIVFNRFIDCRYIHSWFVCSTQLVNCCPHGWRYSICVLLPLYLLSDPPGMLNCVNCVVDHILEEFYTLFLTRFRTYKMASPTPTKMTSKDDIYGVGLFKVPSSMTCCKSIYMWAWQEVGPIVQTLRITELHPPTQIITLNPKITGLYTPLSDHCILHWFTIVCLLKVWVGFGQFWFDDCVGLIRFGLICWNCLSFSFMCTAKTLCRKFETNIPRNETVRPRSYFLHSSFGENLYIPTIGLPILLQENRWTDRGNK